MGCIEKGVICAIRRVTDSQHAFMLLLKCRQNKDENVQVYAERLLNLAEEAFPEGGPSVQRQLVGAFADGLASDRLRLKVMRDNPATVQEAIYTARGEQNLFKRFNLRTGRDNFSISDGGHQPLEIDHYRPRRPFNNQNKKYIKPKQVAAVEKPSQELPFWQYVRAQQIAAAEKTKHIQCWKCRKFGHFARDCRVPGQGN